jgi:hypothetical protein
MTDFDEEPDLGVFVSVPVQEQREPVRSVVQEQDGDWILSCGTGDAEDLDSHGSCSTFTMCWTGTPLCVSLAICPWHGLPGATAQLTLGNASRCPTAHRWPYRSPLGEWMYLHTCRKAWDSAGPADAMCARMTSAEARQTPCVSRRSVSSRRVMPSP